MNKLPFLPIILFAIMGTIYISCKKDKSGNSMNIDGDLTTIESFDCKTLVLVNNDVNVTGDKLKITLTRQ
jgi:hypothetical protein